MNITSKRHESAPARSTAPQHGTQAIARAFSVLKESCASNATGSSIADLTARTGLNRTTVFRILKCLINERAMRYDSSTKRYFLGSLNIELGVAAKEHLDLRTLFTPSLTSLATATGNTIFLMLRSGDDSMCLDRQTGSYPIKALVADIGSRRPLGIGAGGLAILAALGEDTRNEIIKRNEKRLAEFGSSSRMLRAAVRQAHKDKFILSQVYGLSSVRAISLPIFDPAGNPFAAISVVNIAELFSSVKQRQMVAVLRTEVKRLEELISATHLVDYVL